MRCSWLVARGMCEISRCDVYERERGIVADEETDEKES